MPCVGRSLLLGGLLSVVLAAASGAQENDFDDRFCVAPPHEALCPTLPYDQADFSSSFEYRVLVKGAQDPFDVFAWQAFVALNWPAEASGRALDGPIGAAPEAPRVWQSYQRRGRVIGVDAAGAACADAAGPGALLIGELEQADHTVLIDQDRNFVVYDTRLNSVAADYIASNGLQSVAGQAAFDRQGPVSFPQGRLPQSEGAAPGIEPSVLLKTAWRILPSGADETRFLARDAVVHVPAQRSTSGQDLCLSLRLGLVGMHIVMRTQSGNGNEWIWATFEHVDNVPLAGNARDVNSIYAETLFPGGCTAPAAATEAAFSFFDPACPNCRINAAAEGNWAWAPRPPYARIGGAPVGRGSQVVRCWAIFESTADLNRRWQQKLAGTLWRNYMLISTQWRGANKSPLFEHGEVPRYLTNVTIETFIQDDLEGTCLGCHAEATTKTGRPSDFTFLLRHAQ